VHRFCFSGDYSDAMILQTSQTTGGLQFRKNIFDQHFGILIAGSENKNKIQ